MTTRQLTVYGVEHRTARQAIEDAKTSGRECAIRIGGKHLSVERDEADRLEAEGIPFAFLFDHTMADGTRRLVTVPIN